MLQLELGVFQGPLDLLLDLIEREQLDITSVALVKVTDQYLAQVRSGEGIDPAQLADFVAIGARLMLIKSRALLPRPAQAMVEGDEEDPAEELARMLEEYRAFKQVAEALRGREEAGLRLYPRTAPPPDLPPPLGLDDVTLDRLFALMQDALGRVREETPRAVVRRETVTVRQKADELRQRLRRDGRVSFVAWIARARERVEVVVQFLAVLELLKQNELDAEQHDLFGDIVLVYRGPGNE
jgi:segregation and condensation protein A